MIPSLLQIPSAVSDSKLHSVLPNNGKGDFTFDRSTGATRINKDGLIEEVGYFSSELVQNGNFSELGSDVVINGNFDTDSNWTKTQAIIQNGQAIITSPDGSYAAIYQSGILTSGKTYYYSVNVKSISGTMQFVAGSGTNIDVTTTGVKTGYITANGTTIFEIKRKSGAGAFSATIDNVSVKQVDPNDRWSLGTGWSYGDGVASCDGTDGVNISQNNVVENGKTYKITFDISNYVSGTLSGRIGASGSNDFAITANGSYIFNLTSDGTSFIFRSSSFNGSISNISVVEVQGDRPRLSYDITNGVVEDKPHLLLEPSSTNLIKFSEDFTQSEWVKLGIGSGSSPILTKNYAISPDGSKNATRLQCNLNSGATNSDQSLIYDLYSSSSNQTISIYMKSNTGSNQNVYFANTVSSGDTAVVTSEWQRFTFSHSSSTYVLAVGLRGDTGADNTADILIFAAQAEQQSYATSYIPTAGTTITRAAETCNNSKPSVNSTEGVLYCEIAALANDGTFREITLNDGTTLDVVELRYNNVDNQIQFVVRVDGGGVQVNSQVAFSDVLEYNKIAFQYKANDFKVFANGSEVATDTAGSVPSGLNQLDFSWAENNKFYGKVKGLAVYNEALSESQLMQLTGVTASSIYSNFVTRTASFTVEALNEVKKVIDNL